MAAELPRVLLVFLDGVGIGPADPDTNPFLRTELPTLRSLLGGRFPTLDHSETAHGDAVAFPLDALLGVQGLPQSGTGQTALLTGENAPALFGRHFGPWVPVALRPLLRERNLLTRALSSGVSCTFANAYPTDFSTSRWARRPAGPPLAAEAAGLLNRHEEALALGQALASEIVNDGWRTHLGLAHLPLVSPQEAGANLARLAGGARLTFFAHYTTDYVGHCGNMEDAVQALERVDAFLDGLTAALPPRTLLVVASDHGNIEDLTGGHTLNPTLCLLAGPGAVQHRKGMASISDIPELVLEYLRDGSASGTP
ncbi:alkaline phosphatase family protein [Gemmatimonadota bacterium]